MATRPEPRTGQRRRAAGDYPSVLSERLIPRLVAEPCLADRHAGRRGVLAEAYVA